MATTATLDHNTFRCRTRGLLHSAVSAAVAVVFSLPFVSRLALTDVVNRDRSIEVNTVPEPENKDDESLKKYPAKLHARKVAKQLGTENGIIYLPGQLESTWEDSDQGPPFRQRRYFYYMTGANFPGCSVTYDVAADKLTLWIPFTPPATILWFGNTPSPEECLTKSDVHDVKYIGELASYLTARLATVKTLYALRPSQLPRFDGFEQMKPSLKIDVTSLQPAIDEARLLKSEYEIAMVRKANDVSSAAHKKAAMLMYGMKNECEIEAAFLQACTAANAHAQAYPVIAGSGANASTLHYEANNEPLAGRQLVVLDAGAEWNCYASDVTRTLPIGPRYRFSAEAKAVYDLVHRMQDECIQRIQPGVVFRDLQLHATLVAVEGLLELGVLKGGTAEEIFKNGTGAAFFPHGLGHHVGLDVHDVLSRDLLKPAGEGMWGKRRPIGPQSVRAMIKQAAVDAANAPAAAAPSTTATVGISPQPPLTTTPPSSPTTGTATPATTAAQDQQDQDKDSSKDKGKEKEEQKPFIPKPLVRAGTVPLPAFTSSPSEAPPPHGVPRITTTSPPMSPQTSPTKPQRKTTAGTTTTTSTSSPSSRTSKNGKHNTLHPGMIVTVEPGVYFCRPYVEAYFLRREEHARYIDAAVLERYWAVGGARVEDDVLVTEDGREVLTTAPKGAELLKLMGYHAAAAAEKGKET
ncbi:hypothetical protein Hte_002748 [Hypoxylon texense]